MCRAEATREPKKAAADPAELKKGDEWLKDFDFEGFANEIKELGKKLDA
eukprot:CAMPEP_0113616796 /NCGR_PEP_ID=MMETSP0017_2-20120614/8431_1 /TAXON_ID=2856 /ORGANISM="Cylindrotheca closterium" /LENGTH=48 /DNA_ID=CAMNT_0000526135 /DNA_START=251 /DNA_END=394 /DNA_ORIENTATION=+ /assembly_acc=CAM_ASM_000147